MGKHWKNLGNMLSWMPPPPEQANALDSEWVQRINTPKRGVFLFNHLTGAQGFEDELGSLGEVVSSPVNVGSLGEVASSTVNAEPASSAVGKGKDMSSYGPMMAAHM